MFKKILIANRGEIAVRIIEAAHQLKIQTVAVFSEADRSALHIRKADEAYQIGNGNELKDTYLNIEKIIEIAKEAKVDAIHPGYGFLAENPDFVAACERENLVFIGPHTRAIQLMGNKIESRAFVKEIGIPMTEAVTGDFQTLMKAAEHIPFPLLVKAAAGGGGKGMKIVRSHEELSGAIESTSREAANYFGDPAVFVEKYVEEPRHIEIQVIGDKHGNVVHLFERECSIQRRHQKIIEESPSPTLTPEVRKKMCEAAVKIARKIEYNSAGTIEFLVDKQQHFYFLEMNTRIQVEHPVTEEVTGVDLVAEQISVAAGKPLSFRQEEIQQKGHAIECRIYAEDPANNFLPSPGDILFIDPPAKGRIDAAIEKPVTVHSFYDPMISKLIIHAGDRNEAIRKMESALRHYAIIGIKTNIPYLIQLVRSNAFRENKISTKFCDLHTPQLLEMIEKEKEGISKTLIFSSYLAISIEETNLQRKKESANKSLSIWQEIGFWREYPTISGKVDGKSFTAVVRHLDKENKRFAVQNENFQIRIDHLQEGDAGLHINGQAYYFKFFAAGGKNYIFYKGHIFEVSRDDYLVQQDVYVSEAAERGDAKIVSPMPGKVIKINVREGQEVKKGEVLLIVEAMKMENNIVSPKAGVIEQINVAEGDMVDGKLELLRLEENNK